MVKILSCMLAETASPCALESYTIRISGFSNTELPYVVCKETLSPFAISFPEDCTCDNTSCLSLQAANTGIISKRQSTTAMVLKTFFITPPIKKIMELMGGLEPPTC